ncbi:hypothetical protein [Corallococcus aberystwythensis]|uniref:hypothetical protein n=1 Tax=Corallococcus aberystwythensis TaxID=2316722 RepID=UPI000EA078E5|nr:hypothetical protein [Corallococcus aberystwythensis]
MRMRVLGSLWMLGALIGCGGGVEPNEEPEAAPESGTRGQLAYPCNGTLQWYVTRCPRRDPY